jgi:timeless
LSSTSSRHSHFGGTLALQKQNGKVHYLQASVDSLLSVQSGVSASMMINTAEERRKSKKHHVFVGSGRELALHTRPGVSVTSVMQDMGPSNHRANQVLHKFCEKFMDHCYGPVMKSLKNEFRRDSNRLEDGDLRIFFRIIWFFCQWWRVGLKDSSFDGIGPLIVTMDIFMFKRVVKATDHYYDHKKFFDLAQAVALYSEMMHLLNAMYHAKDSTEQVMAFGLMDQLFYHPEPMDILPKLLSRWIPGTFTREYLCDLLELSHVTLKLLDSNAELCAPYLTQKGSKKKRSKNPEESTAEPKDAVSHMKAIASEFDVKSYFTRKLVTNQVVYMYGHLLSHYDVNAVHINKHIITFFVRLEKVEISSYDSTDDIGNDASASVANLEPMLFNVPILTVLNKILCDKNLRNKVEEEFLLTFATGLIRHYVAFAERNPMLYVETLFRHPLPLRFCESSFNMYVTDEMRMIAERDALLEKRKNEDDLPRMEQEKRPFMTSADDDDDGEIEFDQRFGDKFEARGVYVSRSKSKLGKKNQVDKGGRTAVSPSDSEVDRDDDSSVQKSENDQEEGIETVDEKRNSMTPRKRVAVDDEEQLSPLEKGDVGKLRKRIKRVTSDDSSDDEDGILVESRVVIKPNWAEDDDE